MGHASVHDDSMPVAGGRSLHHSVVFCVNGSLHEWLFATLVLCFVQGRYENKGCKDMVSLDGSILA